MLALSPRWIPKSANDETRTRPVIWTALVAGPEPEYGRDTEVFSCTAIQGGVVPGD